MKKLMCLIIGFAGLFTFSQCCDNSPLSLKEYSLKITDKLGSVDTFYWYGVGDNYFSLEGEDIRINSNFSSPTHYNLISNVKMFTVGVVVVDSLVSPKRWREGQNRLLREQKLIILGRKSGLINYFNTSDNGKPYKGPYK